MRSDFLVAAIIKEEEERSECELLNVIWIEEHQELDVVVKKEANHKVKERKNVRVGWVFEKDWQMTKSKRKYNWVQWKLMEQPKRDPPYGG